MMDLSKSTKCEWCGEMYEKNMPGLDVCGTCQITEAIRIHWQGMLRLRWGVLPYDK